MEGIQIGSKWGNETKAKHREASNSSKYPREMQWGPESNQMLRWNQKYNSTPKPLGPVRNHEVCEEED